MHCRSLLALVGLPLLVATADAQDTVATVPSPAPVLVETPRSPTTARLLAIIPSAGHIYAGETGTGLAYLGGMVGVVVIGAVAAFGDCLDDLGTLTPPEPEGGCSSTNTIENITVAAFYGIWGWSIFDAGRAARRSNVRRGFTATAFVAPAPPTGSPRRSGIRLGLTLQTR